jgi:hypothetical protein
MEPEIRGALSQFKAIKEFAQLANVDTERARGLIEEYAEAKNQFEKIGEQMKLKADLRGIYKYNLNQRKDTILQSIVIQCQKAIGVLEAIVIPLPRADADRLSSIREELGKVSGKMGDIYFEKNLEEAMKEYEQRCFLASALIAGRVIIYASDQIPGKAIKEKLENLQRIGLIEKGRSDLEEAILKADKKARNFFSHDIKIMPTASDALSLLGDAVKILGYVS